MQVIKFLSELYQKIKNWNRIDKPVPMGYLVFKNQIVGEVLDRTAPTPKYIPSYTPGSLKPVSKAEILVAKLAFDTKFTSLIFERGFVNRLYHKEPFDMVIVENRTKSVYRNCKIKKMQVAYPLGNAIGADKVELIAEEVKFYQR